MLKRRDVLKLSAAGMSKHEIAASLGVSVTAARGVHLAGAGPGPHLAAAGGLTDEVLEVMKLARAGRGSTANVASASWDGSWQDKRMLGARVEQKNGLFG